MPQEDIEERLAFYSEMVDDRMEEGYLEEETVDAIGPVEEISAHIVADVPLTKIVKEKVTADRRLNAWAIVLLLGAPVWLSLLIAAAAVMFSLYVSVWTVIIALWAVAVSVAVSAAAGFYGSCFLCLSGKWRDRPGHGGGRAGLRRAFHSYFLWLPDDYQGCVVLYQKGCFAD